ncbi:hypothetical protein [Streptomyces qinglanensis]|uniref:Uncharacterized protein n=1 Tax=Streptomyces qinglanensis TaxID=943816 RepID=A0A1H9T5U6_9ACTN|nr:hypothetical protein [Streptomyces qinglanensis]SER92467.1 hypothetical protein SAMN05421870_105351 [Streptomyces qinglanensis]
MPRRVSLPAADELFRTTGGAAVQPSAPQEERSAQVGPANGEAPAQPSVGSPATAPATPGPKVPAPASEPVPEAGGAERSATDESGGEPGSAAAGGARRAARGARGTATADEQRTAPPQQAGPAPGERTGRRGGAAKGRQSTGASGTASPTASAAPAASRRGRAARRPSGRERHDEKITVYVSAEELMDLEHARLVLRGEHGLAVDRGRIVREAVAVVLADLESRGDASILVRRLRGR